MKLYPRQLRSMEELKREKSVLKYVRRQTTKENLLPIDAGVPGSGTGPGGGLMAALGGLMGARTLFDGALAAGLPLLRYMPMRTQKNVLRTVAREFIGGYLRWKMIQMGYRGLKMIIHARRHPHSNAPKHSVH
jgi:hypothetical protein